MPTYRVKPGKFHGPRDEFGPGDLVQYTEYEASGFLDKLELVAEPLFDTPKASEPAIEPEISVPVEVAPAEPKIIVSKPTSRKRGK